MLYDRMDPAPFTDVQLQELGHLKGLKSVLRCRLHAGQGSLAKAIAADPSCQEMVQTLITAYSPANDDNNLGSLARGFHNSSRLKHLFHENVVRAFESLDGKLKSIASFRYAAQRFDSILDIAQLVVLHVRPIVTALLEFRIQDPKKSKWVEHLLTFFTGPKLLLLALLCELAASASRYHHKYDNLGAQPGLVTKSAYWLQNLSEELHRLFFFTHGEPLVLADHYTAGYVSMMRSSYDLLIEEGVISGDRLVFYRPGLRSEANLRRVLARELGSIQNVATLYLQALEPGDVSVAASTTLKPLADILGSDVFA
ncbi:unnamed protein product [Symbiodinium sp. CCMP2592]|nr:unnamed protein product [Symbiodinium sp. CCMP2592]